MIIKRTFLFLFILLSISSCGESPFLDEKPTDDRVRGVQNIETDLVFRSIDLKVKSYWKKGPQVGDESKILIVLFNHDGSLFDKDLDLRLKLWMPTMGHGSFPITMKKLSNGVYEASEVFFTMPGYWDIHFQVFENENLIEEVKWGLNL